MSWVPATTPAHRDAENHEIGIGVRVYLTTVVCRLVLPTPHPVALVGMQYDSTLGAVLIGSYVNAM